MANTRTKWTKEEDEILVQAIEANPHNKAKAFREAAEKVNHSEKCCSSRWYKVLSNKRITMESRNITLTLEKAKEWYNSGSAELKEVALQAFTQEELTTPKYTDIKTFEDAVKALGMDTSKVESDLNCLACLEGGLGEHLTAIYKLDIIRKALNGADWNPKMTEGDIYYGWVRFYKKSRNFPSDKKIIGNFIADGQKYLLVGGFGTCGYCNGFGSFGSRYGYGSSHADLSLLCCKSLEIAQYMSEQFGKLIFDACYAHHVGSYQWV